MTNTTVWPANKRCAAVISVLFDDGADAIAKAPDLANRAKSLSVWQYGANRGVANLLGALESSSVPSTWFVPGSVAQNHAALIRAIADQGHEIASHGWAFERHDSIAPDASIALLSRARDTLEQLAGKAVNGFRLPMGNWPLRFDEQLVHIGHNWSASLNGDDVPYSHRSGLVEIPVHIELEDRPYFQFNFTPAFPKGQSRIPSYEAVLGNWIAEFDAYRKFGLCFVLQLRPEMTGTPGRIWLVQALLDHIAAFDDVWIATGSQIADWHLANKDRGNEPQHPLRVFDAYRSELDGQR